MNGRRPFLNVGRCCGRRGDARRDSVLLEGFADLGIPFCAEKHALLNIHFGLHVAPDGFKPCHKRLIASLGRELEALGTCNFLMSDSRCLYAYCSSTLHWITRRAPFGEAHSIDTGEIVDFCRETTARDVVTVVASKPLTDNERWHPIPRASLQVFVQGVPLLGN